MSHIRKTVDIFKRLNYNIQKNLVDALAAWDLETYKRRQLSNFLLVKYSSAFKKPIDGSNFQGTVSMNKIKAHGNLIMIKTSCTFYDNHGGWAERDVNCAIFNSFHVPILGIL